MYDAINKTDNLVQKYENSRRVFQKAANADTSKLNIPSSVAQGKETINAEGASKKADSNVYKALKSENKAKRKFSKAQDKNIAAEEKYQNKLNKLNNTLRLLKSSAQVRSGVAEED